MHVPLFLLTTVAVVMLVFGHIVSRSNRKYRIPDLSSPDTSSMTFMGLFLLASLLTYHSSIKIGTFAWTLFQKIGRWASKQKESVRPKQPSAPRAADTCKHGYIRSECKYPDCVEIRNNLSDWV